MSNVLSEDEFLELKQKIREVMKAEAVQKISKVDSDIEKWAETERIVKANIQKSKK